VIIAVISVIFEVSNQFISTFICLVRVSFERPGEDGHTPLVPDVGRDAMCGDPHAAQQVLALFVEVDGDLDVLALCLLVSDLAAVDPLEVGLWQARRQGLGQPNPLRFFGVRGTFHAHVVDDEALLVSGDLVVAQVQFELELELFE